MSGIFCVESLWSQDTGSQRTSMAPLLEYVGRSFGVRHTTFDCGTLEELALRLGKSRKSGYDILYFAGHGSKGKFLLDGGVEVTLERLGEMMNHRFEGWNVHFSSCATLDVNQKTLRTFKRSTKAGGVSGYKKYVDWKESSALDLMWISHLASGERFEWEAYKAMITRLGFVVI